LLSRWARTVGLSVIVVAVIGVMGRFDIISLVVALAVATVVFLVGRVINDTVNKPDTSDRPPAFRDVKVLALGAQLAAVGIIFTALGWLWGNFRDRTDAIGLNLDFDFLSQPGQIRIADNPLTPGDTVAEAILAGLGNTVRIILIGVPLALILGTLVGIARLSTNWLLRKIATFYVETIRNIPPLVVIVFIWGGVFLVSFPRAQESWKPLGEWFIFNNSRFAFPSIKGVDQVGLYQGILLAGLIVAGVVWWWRTRLFNEHGTPHRRSLWATGSFAAIAVVGYVALGGPIELSKPLLDEAGRVYTDGIRMQMPYAALLTALVLYTATHIAEIVRGSILSVPKGQVEAGNALALSAVQRYRFVVLPQAMRVAWPPLISQFLNFTKNSSLALAIGFAEVTSVIANLFGQSQPAPQLILILMLSYLVLSLLISAVGNLVNRRLEIVGR
jgi:general L-amino acid transport system permease protein